MSDRFSIVWRVVNANTNHIASLHWNIIYRKGSTAHVPNKPRLELATVLPVVNASDTLIYSELLLLNTAKVKSYDAAIELGSSDSSRN